MGQLGDRRVEIDEVVEVPDDLVESFRAAGWRPPGEKVVWPPDPEEPPTKRGSSPPPSTPSVPPNNDQEV